jgi:SAM-dependent methyltransferase/uncharacterized protein YbaR (Trm112 family)
VSDRRPDLDPWYLETLVCPVDRSELSREGDALVSAAGRRYPVVEGVPVMLREDTVQTLHVAEASLRRARREAGGVDERAPSLHLESLGLGEEEKVGVVELAKRGDLEVDPVVAFLVAATGGLGYEHLVGRLATYPIPDLRLPPGNGKAFLDLGCNWGRWSIAAARMGYATTGIDPQLGAVLAARRVARQLGLPNRYLVADARFLPFRAGSVDTVFSYSVLQHLSKENVRAVLEEAARVLKPGGTSLVQMPNRLAIRSLMHQARRGFRAARGFEVRYWSIAELRRTFREAIGTTSISVDCYFGLGLQKSDIDLMTPGLRALVRVSELLRGASTRLGVLKHFADSVYVRSVRGEDPS